VVAPSLRPPDCQDADFTDIQAAINALPPTGGKVFVNAGTHGDGHVLTMRSRFIPESILDMFERRAHGHAASQPLPGTGPSIRIDVAARMREIWE
jgi:hypothetical protein